MATHRRSADRPRRGTHPARAQRRTAGAVSVFAFLVIMLSTAASSRGDDVPAVDREHRNRPAAARVVLVGTTTTSTPDALGEVDDPESAPDDAPFGKGSDPAADR